MEALKVTSAVGGITVDTMTKLRHIYQVGSGFAKRTAAQNSSFGTPFVAHLWPEARRPLSMFAFSGYHQNHLWQEDHADVGSL
jgi:hypothetical protein